MKVKVDVELREDQLALEEVQYVLQNPEKFLVEKYHYEQETGCCRACKEPQGEPHLLSCKFVSKHLHVRVKGKYPIEVPCHWTKEFFEHHRQNCPPQDMVELTREDINIASENGYSHYGKYLELELVNN